MNTIHLIGRLTKSPEVTYTQNNNAVCNFTVAVPDDFNRQEVDFINCVVWKKQAEALEKYCEKGSQIAIVGKLTTQSYKEDTGNTKFSTKVNCNRIEFVGTKENKKNNSTANNDSSSSNEMLNETVQELKHTNIEINDDDLPF